MASFSFYGNPVLTATEFNEMISNDKQLRAIRYAIGYRHEPSHETRYHVDYRYNECRDLTDEQRETARKLYEERREQVRQEWAQPGTLFIVTMGADWNPRTADDIANHRVRVQFIDKSGDLCGVEFMPTAGGFTFDRWNRSADQRENDHYTKEMARLEKKYKGRFIPFEERPEFPMHRADRGTSDGLPYTTAGVLAWFENVQGLKFKRVYIDRYFFACDEITSTTKKSRKK